MYNGIKEDMQKAIDYMCLAVMETRANGCEEHNHICGLKVIDLPEDVKRWWGWQEKGKYVRVIWSDSPDRDDGYYDININGSSAFGALSTVWKFIDKKL